MISQTYQDRWIHLCSLFLRAHPHTHSNTNRPLSWDNHRFDKLNKLRSDLNNNNLKMKIITHVFMLFVQFLNSLKIDPYNIYFNAIILFSRIVKIKINQIQYNFKVIFRNSAFTIVSFENAYIHKVIWFDKFISRRYKSCLFLHAIS